MDMLIILLSGTMTLNTKLALYEMMRHAEKRNGIVSMNYILVKLIISNVALISTERAL